MVTENQVSVDQKVVAASLATYHQLITKQAITSSNSGKLRCLVGVLAVDKSACRIST